jgi:hypothetical protein
MVEQLEEHIETKATKQSPVLPAVQLLTEPVDKSW